MNMTSRRLLAPIVAALFMASRPGAFAEAYLAPQEEMIARAEVIAVVEISRVEHAENKGKVFKYSEIAQATVQQTLKGKLPETVKLSGGESFICTQVHFAPGRYLVFLCRDNDLLVGCNWHLSGRPIKDTQVEWYVPGERLQLSWQSLETVRAQIQQGMAQPKSQ